MFTLEQIQILTAIVDTGSLSKASKRLGKTKGAVSISLSNLEDELGILLFDRSGWKLVLTGVGEQIYQQAKIWQRQALQIQRYAQAYAEDIEPTLRLGIQRIIPAIELHHAIDNFRANFPYTQIHLVRDDDDQLVQKLRDGEIDLLIKVQTEASVSFDLEFANVGLLEFVFACAPDYLLADMRAVGNEGFLLNTQVILDLGSEITTSRQRLGYETIVAATHEDFLYQVEMGQGWCLLPKSIFQERAGIGSLVQLKPSFEGENITVIMLEMLGMLDRPQSSAFLALKEALVTRGKYIEGV